MKARTVFRAAGVAAALALLVSSAQAWPGPSPYPPFFYPYPPPAFRAPPAPAPPPQTVDRGCDGSEPVLGGIFGAWAGGLLGAALGQDRHGQIDPGATAFGAIAGAMLGATLAASSCDNYR
jgi:hypothetical protein